MNNNQKNRSLTKALAGILAVAAVFSLTACSSTPANTSTGTPANTSAGSKPADEGATYQIKMANPSNPDDNCVKAFYKFEELVEAASDKKVDVEIFHSGQLGAHRDYIEGLQMGSMQMAEINTSVLTSLDSKFMVFDLPYIAKGMDHEIEVINGGLGDTLSKSLEGISGIKILGWMVRTPRSVYSSRGPINTAADFKGLKIRVMESPIMVKTMELLGAVPVPISASERYMALQTKVVDAAENSIPLVITQKEYEVTKYISLTEHFCTPNVIAASADFYNKLPDDLQKIVSDSAVEAGAYASKLDKESLEAAIEELKGFGMEINEVPDKSTFIAAVTPVYEQYEKEIGKDIIDTFLKS